MSADLIDLVQRLGQPRVLVVGDLMLDRYVWGDAERISQEAPVILLHADRREERLGGASSVATMLRALGAKRGPGRRRRRRRRRRPHPPAAHRPRHRRRGGARCRLRPAQHGQGALHRPGPAPPSAADDPRRLRGPHAAGGAESKTNCARSLDRPDAQSRRRPHQRLRQGRLHAGAAGRRSSPPRDARRTCPRRPDPRRRLPQVSRLLRHHAQPPGGGAGHGPHCADLRTSRLLRQRCCASGSTWRRPSSRSTRTAWPWPIATAGDRSFRPGRARSTTSPGPATW